MHPPLQIHPDGKVDALADPSSGEGNAVCVWLDGEPWAVRVGAVGLPSEGATSILAPAVFPQWAGTTGDLIEGTLRVRGPLTQANITAPDGTGLSFEATLTATEYVFVDIRGFVAWRGDADDWEPTGEPVLLDYPAAGPLRVSPQPEGVVLAMTGDGFTAGTTGLALRAPRFWL